MVNGFGYRSSDEVKSQFDQCMLRGELESIYKDICLMDSPDGHGRNEGHDNEGILEKKCDLVRNAIELIEQYCLVNLYSNQFFWN